MVMQVGTYAEKVYLIHEAQTLASFYMYKFDKMKQNIFYLFLEKNVRK